MNSENKEHSVSRASNCEVNVEPQWRKDFPIDVSQDHYIARRDFTKFMIMISSAFVAGQFFIIFLNIKRRMKGELPMQRIAGLNELKPGQSMIFAYPEEHNKCLLVRVKENKYVAFSASCTHLACAILPEPEKNRFLCPCHNGSFDMESGRPLSGPPRRQLPRILLEIRDDNVYATGLQL